jgi:virginiamycin B lyase
LIIAGPDGNIWFTEADGNKIGRSTLSGVITELSLPTSSSRPESIAAGPDGNLWFTEAEGNKIGCISPLGTISEFPLPVAGSHPSNITAGPDGRLWFTESGNNRVGRITSYGTITEFAVHTAAAGLDDIVAGLDGNLWFTEGDGKVATLPAGGQNTDRAMCALRKGNHVQEERVACFRPLARRLSGRRICFSPRGLYQQPRIRR